MPDRPATDAHFREFFLAALSLAPLLLPACSRGSADAVATPEVHTYGTLQEALRMDHSEGRVVVADVVHGTTLGVGALAGLAGEVTILEGRAYLSRADGDSLSVRDAAADDQATVLAVADVEHWRKFPLPACAEYSALEKAVAAILTAEGVDPHQVVPFRVTGVADSIDLHVIHGACPIAHPDGPPPWRHHAEHQQIELVGFFARDSEGQLTHHGRQSHVHALTADHSIAGHLDDLTLPEGATLWLPSRG